MKMFKVSTEDYDFHNDLERAIFERLFEENMNLLWMKKILQHKSKKEKQLSNGKDFLL